MKSKIHPSISNAKKTQSAANAPEINISGKDDVVLDAAHKKIDIAFTYAIKKGVMRLNAEDATIDGRILTVHGHKTVNFGSCSYTGLETDPRLKAGIIEAAEKYGSQFAASRAYVSAPAYKEFQMLIEKMFNAPVVLAQTTSLGHLGVLPVLIQKGDIVLYDMRVHASVQAVFPTLAAAGVECVPIKHNRMDMLEARINKAIGKYRKIWFLCDGIYSMHGDFVPLDDLRRLVEKYPELHLYIDDAHAVSWMGKHGSGYVLGTEAGLRTRTVVAVSLSKSFSASGAAIIFPGDPELCRLVGTCGSTMIFSGPIHPPMLGACIASARIHLSDEIYQIQKELQDRIRLFNSLCEENGLTPASLDLTPIRFLEVGSEEKVFEITDQLMKKGFYVNIAIYPAVFSRAAGLRITITRHQTLDDIRNLVGLLAKLLPSESPARHKR